MSDESCEGRLCIIFLTLEVSVEDNDRFRGVGDMAQKTGRKKAACEEVKQMTPPNGAGESGGSAYRDEVTTILQN